MKKLISTLTALALAGAPVLAFAEEGTSANDTGVSSETSATVDTSNTGTTGATNANLRAEREAELEEKQQERAANAEERRTTIDAKQMHTEVLIESVVEAKVTESDPQIKYILAGPITSPLRCKFGIHDGDTYSAPVVIQNFVNYFSTTLEGQEMIKQVRDLFVELVSYGRIKEGNKYFPKNGHVSSLSDTSLEDVKLVLKGLHLATLRTKENLSAFFAINAEREENDLDLKDHLHGATISSDYLFINIHHPTEVRNVTIFEPGFDLLETQRQWTKEASLAIFLGIL